ncbi:hypothetical protein VTK56DRAFT_9407 [Thermocarpiscus australiensis]
MAPFTLVSGVRQRTKLAYGSLSDEAVVIQGLEDPVRRSSAALQHLTDAANATEDGLEAGDDCAEELSVALEWKLLLPLLACGASDPQPDDGRRVLEASCEEDDEACLVQAHEHVAETITETGEKAITIHAISRQVLEEKDFWDSSWIVKKANSAQPLDDAKSLKGYVWVPVEICSPKMRVKDPETRARMRKVLEWVTSRHRLAANCTCEVHVHLGRMDGRSWSLPTLKRLGTFLWVAEPTLRSIRDPNSPNSGNVYTWGFEMRRHSRLAKGLKLPVPVAAQSPPRTPPNFPMGIPDTQVVGAIRDQVMVPVKELKAFEEIWKASTRLELGRLLSGPEKKYRRLGFNFSAFGEEDERARRSPRTMEFRMMEGSVRTDLVLSWVVICGIIAESAVTKSDGRFSAALSRSLHHLGTKHTVTVAGCEEKSGAQLGREFRELMRALGVSHIDYLGFEEKIRREHK